MQLYNRDCSSPPRRRGACSHRYLPCALLFSLRVLRSCCACYLSRCAHYASPHCACFVLFFAFFERSDRSQRKLKCFGCKSEDHIYKDRPKKTKNIACDLCGSTEHLWDACTMEPDPQKLFAKHKERKAQNASRRDQQVAAFQAHSIIALLLSDKDNAPASFEHYDPIFDALPDNTEIKFVGDKEGVRLQYGSSIEAEAAFGIIQKLERENKEVRFQYRKEPGPGARTSYDDGLLLKGRPARAPALLSHLGPPRGPQICGRLRTG